MKKFLAIILSVILLLSAAGCANTHTQISDSSQATLKFIYGDKEIVQVLDAEDTAKMSEIFSNKPLDGGSVPSCGFDEDISITFGNQTFAIACDDCAVVKDCKNNKYFDISNEDKEYIVSVFEEYGGHFPCV